MEPVAPGTEDDQPVAYSASTKQEKERERLLSEKAILPNGRYGNVFEFKYQNGAEHWYCNACACPVMGWVFHHEVGRRHKTAVGNNSSDDKIVGSQEVDEPAIQIAPGEPIPPGFEGQVEKVAAIQERLDVFTVGPLVALEYLLELKDYDANKEPTYLCVLCDKKGDPRTVLTHLASYKHIMQYLQKHFPTSYRALAPYMTKQYKRNWQEALHKVAEAIEKKFGRLKPMPVDADKYVKDQSYYLTLVAKGRHFSELSGYTFEELISKEELTKVHEDEAQSMFKVSKPINRSLRKKSPSPPVVAHPIKKIKHSSHPTPSSAQVGTRRRSLSSVSSITSSDLSDFEEGAKQKRKNQSKSPAVKPPRSRSRSPARRVDNRRHVPRRDIYDRDRYGHLEQQRRPVGGGDDRSKPDRGLMPWERSNYRRTRPDMRSSSDRLDRDRNSGGGRGRDCGSNSPESDKTNEFKKLCRAIDNDMDRVLKNHKKNPEKHPSYNEEWKMFWNRRYKELQAEGKDAASHDFKPEWIEFWNSRMAELHQEEIKAKKEALRKRLGLLEDPAPISFKIQKGGGPRDRASSKDSLKPLPTAALPDNDSDVIVIDDKDDGKNSKRSHSPWEDEPFVTRKSDKVKQRKEARSKGSPPQRASNERREKERRSYSKGRHDGSPKATRGSFERSPRRRAGSRERYQGSRSRSRSWERDYKKPWERPSRVRMVSDLPWERDRDRDRDRERGPKYRDDPYDPYKPPAKMRDVTRKPVISPTPPQARDTVPPVEEDAGEINVVSVLRLLTALEEKLGSLGPKVIDLLTQALAMEKNEANSSETLLDNDINCVMFETVKEKLKGQLLAGLVDYVQERAFKNAIKKIASLVHMAGERKKEREKLNPKVDPVKVPGVGTVDKAAIARQIATALVSQGKTDVTQAELEQLINAVVGMAEASRNSNKPMTTASFLEQINQGGVNIIKKEKSPSPPPVKVEQKSNSPEKQPTVTTPSMEGLSDSDLQTLLQNFKDLSTEEQHGLINYLRKLEAHEPDRVERLRKFVNLGGGTGGSEKQQQKPVEIKPAPVVKPPSPFAKRMEFKQEMIVKKPEEVKKKEEIVRMPIDSDEEDYSFEDVVKAASNNVKQKELEKKRDEESNKAFSIDDTKALISNIMSNINKAEAAPPAPAAPPQQPSMGNLFGLGSSLDLAKTLHSLPVDMASLASIVGNVQSLSNTNSKPVAPPSTGAGVPKLSFQLPSISYPKAGQVSEARLRGDEPFHTQNYHTPQRPNNPPSFQPPPGNQGFYGHLGQQQNVAYPPTLDKSKVSYPNYSLYGAGPDQIRFEPPRRGPEPPNNQPPFRGGPGGNNQYNRGNNRDNFRW